MRERSFVLVLIVLFSAASAYAQGEGRPKFFIGYSNLQGEGLREKNDPDNVLSPGFLDRRSTLHGANAAVNFPIRNFGITGDVSFNRNREETELINGEQSIKTDVIYFVGGPSFEFRNNSRVQPFVRALGGGARTNFRVETERDLASGTATNSFKVGSTDLAVMVGGGIDLRVNDKVRLRVFQMDYAPIFLGDRAITVLGTAGALQTVELEGQRQDHVRFSFGVTF